MKKKIPLYDEDDFERAPIGASPLKKEESQNGDPRSPFQRDLSRLIHSPAFRKLQGKTQIFPGLESDFFRNRLTHSMEVADIGKSVALRVNAHDNWKEFQPLDLDLINFACLAHDLGHPPFGHVGERALNTCMKSHGRFEGNAQTLRILTKIEKKRTYPDTERTIYQNNGWQEIEVGLKYADRRLGLNLTSRALASILKYDEIIKGGNLNTKEGVIKGYYESDSKTIKDVKNDVLKKYDPKVAKKYKEEPKFKTIECSIMDLADDIAYTVFDLEDGLKSGFINLYDLLFINESKTWFPEFIQKIARSANSRPNLLKYLSGIEPKGKKIASFEGIEFYNSHTKKFFDLISSNLLRNLHDSSVYTQLHKLSKSDGDISDVEKVTLYLGALTHAYFNEIAQNGYFRSKLTTGLITYLLDNIQVVPDPDVASMSKVDLNGEALLLMEVIKQFIFVSQVKSSRMQLVEFRGHEMVKEIFQTLTKDKNALGLLPNDYKMICSFCKNDDQKLYRVICDFISGMTDRYAVEFYCRLYGENPQSFFKGV